MGISASHATEFRLWHWCASRDSHPWPSFKGYIFNVVWLRHNHLWKALICWLLTSLQSREGKWAPRADSVAACWGNLDSRDRDGEDERHHRNQTGDTMCETICLTPACISLSSWTLLSLQTAPSTLLLNHFPKALSDILGCCTNTRGVCS